MKVNNNVSNKPSPAVFAGCLIERVKNPSHLISTGQRTTASYTRHKEAPLSTKAEDDLDDLPLDYTGAGDGVLEGVLEREYLYLPYLAKGGDGQSFVSFWEGKFGQEEDFLLDEYEGQY